MSDHLDQTLATAGYAKVLVTLADASAAADQVEAALSDQFIAAPQAAELAMAASRFSETDSRPRKLKVYPRLGLAVGYVDNQGAAALRQSRRVQRVDAAPELSLIRPVRIEATPATAAAAAPITWGLQRLGAPELWRLGFTGQGVRVAHLDTGVDGAHPAFPEGSIAAFAEVDLSGEIVPGDIQPWDSGDHGTHTAATILGRPTAERGRFGMAPDAQLVSALVIEGGQVIDRVLTGMEWALGHEVRILSMSLGLRGWWPQFQTVIDSLRAHNVLPVIAVGNEGPNSSRSPGNYANVLSVGAMDNAERVADFSSSMRFNRADDPLVPDLVAPGVDVLSAVPGGGYAMMDGSSMATPHVAGLAALLASAEPQASASDIEKAILESCVRPATMPQGRANRGVPDGVAALQLLGVPTTASAAPVS